VQARRDVKAAEETLRATSAQLEGQDHNTLPDLELSVSVGYTGALDDDGVGPFFAAPGRHVEGVNGGASLSLELPLGNVERKAARDLASARRSSAEIARDDLQRNVRIEVMRALADLRLHERALSAARQAEASYAQALSDERDKLKAGLSTVIDVVLTEELSTQAQLGRVANELVLALALARLRFAQGALPAIEAELGSSTETLFVDGGARANQQ
jgi:outer membrane protein TolC